jgi:hypothetical protein
MVCFGMIFNVLNLLQKRSHSPDVVITASSHPWLGTTSCSTLTDWFGRTSRKGDELPFERHSSRNQLGFHQRRVDIKLILGWYWITLLNSYSLRLNHNCLGFNSHMGLSRDGVYSPKKSMFIPHMMIKHCMFGDIGNFLDRYSKICGPIRYYHI